MPPAPPGVNHIHSISISLSRARMHEMLLDCPPAHRAPSPRTSSTRPRPRLPARLPLPPPIVASPAGAATYARPLPARTRELAAWHISLLPPVGASSVPTARPRHPGGFSAPTPAARLHLPPLRSSFWVLSLYFGWGLAPISLGILVVRHVRKYVGHGLIESHHKNGLISDFLKFSHFLGFHRFGAIW
jgi:hypothetical protein